MPQVECPWISCIHNDGTLETSGLCHCEIKIRLEAVNMVSEDEMEEPEKGLYCLEYKNGLASKNSNNMQSPDTPNAHSLSSRAVSCGCGGLSVRDNSASKNQKGIENELPVR